MRGPRIPRLPGFKNYLNNCLACCCTSMLFSNMRGTHTPWIFGFKNYLNNCFAYCCASMLFSNMRGTRIPWLFRLKNYLNSWFAIVGHLCFSLICVELVSPGSLGYKII